MYGPGNHSRNLFTKYVVWDVVNMPNAINIAYTSTELDLHQDLMYINFLKCDSFM